MPCRRQSSASLAPASYSLTIPMICSSVNRLVRICPPPERRSNRFSLSVAPFQGAGSRSAFESAERRVLLRQFEIANSIVVQRGDAPLCLRSALLFCHALLVTTQAV